MIDIRKQFAGDGFLITDSPYDTTNIQCRRGHIFSDGGSLVAALTTRDRAECRALRKLGEVIADGGDELEYELSVRFPLSSFRDVAKIMRPRQAALSKIAA